MPLERQLSWSSQSSSTSRPYSVTGRRTWKNLKGKEEAVWPPDIEAILIEGMSPYPAWLFRRPFKSAILIVLLAALEKYCPGPSANTKILGRFPKRNRFISDYIFNVTNKRRSPKQVGSRIQQLRDTCDDPHIQALLSRTRYLQHNDSSPDAHSGSDGSQSNPGSPIESVGFTPARRTLSAPVLSSSPAFSESSPLFPSGQTSGMASVTSSSQLNCGTSSLPASPLYRQYITGDVNIDILSGNINISNTSHSPFIISSVSPRPLQHPRPSVTLISSFRQPSSNYYSNFTVHAVGGTPVYSEVTRFTIRPEPSPSGASTDAHGLRMHSQRGPTQYLYETALAPTYWKKIAESLDASSFMIVQHIMRSPAATNEIGFRTSDQDVVVMPIQYRFTYSQRLVTTVEYTTTPASVSDMESPLSAYPDYYSMQQSLTTTPSSLYSLDSPTTSTNSDASESSLYYYPEWSTEEAYAAPTVVDRSSSSSHIWHSDPEVRTSYSRIPEDFFTTASSPTSGRPQPYRYAKSPSTSTYSSEAFTASYSQSIGQYCQNRTIDEPLHITKRLT